MPTELTILAEQDSQVVLRRRVDTEQEAGCLRCHKAQCNVFFGGGCICINRWGREAYILGHWVGFLKHVSHWSASLKDSRNLCKISEGKAHIKTFGRACREPSLLVCCFLCIGHCVRVFIWIIEYASHNNFEVAEITISIYRWKTWGLPGLSTLNKVVWLEERAQMCTVKCRTSFMYVCGITNTGLADFSRSKEEMSRPPA